MAILFKATTEEAEALRKNLGSRYPAEEFSMSKISYPSYNKIHCFEIHVESGDASDAIQVYISESLSGISASRI